MRLFLIAAIPLVLSVPAQMAIGINKIKVIALAALAGSVVNLPISCYLTDAAGCVRSDLGYRADHAVLESSGTRHLLLSCSGDRPANLPETDAWPSLAGAAALICFDWCDSFDAFPSPSSGHTALVLAVLPAGLASDRRHYRLHRRLLAGACRAQRLGRAFRQSATTMSQPRHLV